MKYYHTFMTVGMAITIVLLVIILIVVANHSDKDHSTNPNSSNHADYDSDSDEDSGIADEELSVSEGCAYRGLTPYDGPIDGETCAAQCNDKSNPNDTDFSCCQQHCTLTDGVWGGCADYISTNCRRPPDQW
jgi:hypothetical protein